VPPVHLNQCDRRTIETALATPQAGFGGVEIYVGLTAKAAVLVYTLAKSQACVDGNKRIAFILLNEFLAINGAALELSNDDAVDLILHIAESDRSERDDVLAHVIEILDGAVLPLAQADDDPDVEEAG